MNYYLNFTNRRHLLAKESSNKRCKSCNVTFRKKKMKSVDKVECNDDRGLIQVSTKADMERVIMKEKKDGFNLHFRRHF